jgi:hypothetical protein
MRKKINWIRHLVVFLTTFLIFMSGILIGDQVDDLRVNEMYLKLQEQDLDFQNILIEKDYLENLIDEKESGRRNVSCEFLEYSYVKSLKYLDSSRINLEQYTQEAGSRNELDFELLKKYYSNIQINYWLLTKKINTLCDSEMNSILYFYGEKKSCPECYDQGIHLDYVKQVLQDDISIFVFDAEKDGPAKLILSSFNVTGALPYLIIDDDEYNYLTNEEIFGVLCEKGLNNSVCLK